MTTTAALLLGLAPLLALDDTEAGAEDAAPRRIAWYGTLEGAFAEAEASNRPILLMSAAPRCSGVPGMW